MKLKYIFYGVLGVSLIVGYNYWLIQRDQKLFDSYDQSILQQEMRTLR